MRLFGILAALATLGVAAGVALADPVPIPGVTTVTTPLPVPPLPTTTLPVSPPPTPTLPAPTTTSGSGGGSGPVATVTTAVNNAVGSASATTGNVSGSTGSAGGSGGGSSTASSSSRSSSSAPAPGGGGTSAGGSSAASGSASVGLRPQHFQSSRTWISTTGPKKRRVATLTFVLPRRGHVLLTVTQVAPVCRAVGHITVTGHRGLNRYRFNGRVRGKRLEPGTYRISLRTPSGRLVRRIILVVSAGAVTPAEVRAARATNTCAAASFNGFGFSLSPFVAGTATSSGGGSAPGQLDGGGQQPQTGGVAPQAPNLHSGVLGSTVEKTARAIRWFLVALLAVAIVLLGAASLPRMAVSDARINDLLARHRVELAGLGALALAAVAVAFLL
jgi:hypothetical protein